jgi:hypothetical protein
LNGSVVGASGGKWSTSGTGNFSPDDVTLNGSYVPSASDMNNGSVTLTLTSTGSGSCNPGSDNLTITINTCTGILASNKPDYLMVYPSPSSSIVNIEAKAGVMIKEVKVLSTLQEEMDAKLIEIINNKAILDLSNLNSGIYFVRIYDGSNVYLERVIKE